jgi:hypothetical protein
VLVVIRFRPAAADPAATVRDARAALDLFSGLAGWRAGRVGRAVDDPGLWVLASEWDSVGAYRRAMTSWPVRSGSLAFLATALDEPTAYEVLAATGLGSEGLAGPSGAARP